MIKLIKVYLLLKQLMRSKTSITFVLDQNWSIETVLNFKDVINFYNKGFLLKYNCIGVSLLDLGSYLNFQDYLNRNNGKNSIYYYYRKHVNLGYEVRDYERAYFINDIIDVNKSKPIRQGRKMKNSYLTPKLPFENLDNFRYFGLFNNEGKLIAYLHAGFFGDFVIIANILGHADYLKHGIMYVIITHLVSICFERNIDKIIYSSHIFCSESLRVFKEKNNFNSKNVTVII